MLWRLKIGRAAGIDVFLHWSFILAPLYIIYLHWHYGITWPIVGIMLVLLFAIFGCVILHEYGHAMAARYFGVRTQDIIITPIGGLARLSRMPSDPLQEFAIAIAGPLVNLTIAIGFAFFITATGRGLVPNSGAAGLLQFPQLMLWLNLFLFLFNLIPAFPMDGGRILRSLLAVSLKHETATLIAGLLGQIVAVAFIVYGIYSAKYLLSLIGTFVFLAAGAEIAMRHRNARAGRDCSDSSKSEQA